MSKLFDFSSLAMIPSAYKDGKLYSVRPTDGSGDFTFSRGSNLAATRVDVNGLIEKGRENLLLQSNQFDTTWTTSNASVTSGQPDKDGGSDAWLLSKSGASGRLLQNVSNTNVSTYSIYAKAGTLDWILLFVLDSNVNPRAYFDLSNGTIGTNNDIIDSSIEDVGNGWYRCSITYKKTITQVRIFPADGDNDISGTSGSIYIQNAQAELGLVATDYIETGASTAQAGILEDMPRLDYSGSCPALLLEPQRSNSFPQSEYPSTSTLNLVNGGYTWTHNQINSPEGVQNASKWAAANNNAVVGVYQNFSATSGASYTFSVFAKKGNHNFIQLQNGGGGSGANSYANFDLENGTKSDGATITDSFIDDFGNGWYRIGITFTTSSTTTSNCSIDIIDSLSAGRNSTFTGSVGDYFYVWGMQVEAGSYPTSYIPTYGTSVTRSDDYMQVTPTDLLGSDTGTWFMEMDDMTFEVTGTSVPTIYLGDNTSNCLAIEGRGSSNKIVYLVKEESNSVTTLHSFTISGKTKFCFVWDGTTLKVFRDGTERYSSTSFTQPTNWDSFIFNQANREAFAEIGNVTLFPTALTDSECIALTTI